MRSFKHFNSKQALSLGLFTIEYAKQTSIVIALEIFLNGREVFLYMPDSLGIDKRDWLRRKRNSVLYFGISTSELTRKLNSDESILSLKYGRKHKDYTLVAGSIPICMQDLGVIGAFSITGLSPEQDHEIAAYCLEHFDKL